MKIAALILAAGYSARMGDFKPLMMLGGKTLPAHAVERFRAADIDAPAALAILLGNGVLLLINS